MSIIKKGNVGATGEAENSIAIPVVEDPVMSEVTRRFDDDGFSASFEKTKEYCACNDRHKQLLGYKFCCNCGGDLSEPVREGDK